MNRNKLLGAWGEAVAGNYLRKKRYKLVSANYNTRFGEIDLIAVKGKYMAFVEVKLRKTAEFAEAREFVDRRKQDRIRAAASIYLEYHPTNLQPRFDVIEIYAPEGLHTENPVINHLEDAFQ